MKNHVIAIDAMGGDNAPLEIVKGAVESINTHPVNILLVGKEDMLWQELKKYTYDSSRVKIINATQVIETTEMPTVAIKQKTDSSIVTGLCLLKEDKAKAFISAGSTGALLTGATLKVGYIKGIKRPALATLLPTEKGVCLLIDCGANVDSKPEYLIQFAQMGSLYMENVVGIKNPKVALVNIGLEAEKGNALTKEAHALLLKENSLNFTGNIEARDVLVGTADVIVCDGFVGNVILKSLEGAAAFLFSVVKSTSEVSADGTIGSFLAQNYFKNVKEQFDYSETGGGAIFLGLKHLIIKAHGSAKAKNIVEVVKQVSRFIDDNLVQKIEEQILEATENDI